MSTQEQIYDMIINSQIEKRAILGYMNVGGTHFKRERERYRQSDYTLFKALKEFIDNIIFICKNIAVSIKLTDKGKIYGITISDDHEKGFENIKKTGIDNPFNMTHIRNGQQTDSETSTFGIGMKSAAISVCDKMTVYTQVDGKFYKIVCDFNEMSNEPIAAYSFDPRIFEITNIEYAAYHPYQCGSTLYFENINIDLYRSTNLKDLNCASFKELSECYGEIVKLNAINIFVNEQRVEAEKNYFIEQECVPFNREYTLIMCKVTTKKIDECGEHTINEDIEYFCKNMNEKDEIKSYKIYNKETSNFCALKLNECEKFGLIKKEKKAPTKKSKALKMADEITVEFLEPLTENDKECMILKGTFLMYHPDLNTQNKVLNEKLYPNGRARLFRDNRCYGNWNSENTTYGSSNFTDIRIEFKSKKLANMMGLTWNKNISKGHQNDLSFAMRGIIKIITSELNGNTGSTANEKLYNIARLHKINVPTSRLPTIIKEDDIQSVKPSQVKPQTVNPVIKTQETKVVAKPVVLDSDSESDSESEAESEAESPLGTESVKKTIVTQNEPELQSNNLMSNQLQQKQIEPLEKKPTNKQDITIKVSEGIAIINEIKNSEDYEEYLDDIKNIIKTDYLKNTSSNHVDLLMNFYPNSKVIYDVLLALIQDKYVSQNYESTVLLGGSKLFALHKNIQK